MQHGRPRPDEVVFPPMDRAMRLIQYSRTTDAYAANADC